VLNPSSNNPIPAARNTIDEFDQQRNANPLAQGVALTTRNRPRDTDHSRHLTNRRSLRLEPMADDEDLSLLGDRRQRRIKVVAWVVIVALILVAGGATVLALLFG